MADGCPPDASAAHQLRARQIVQAGNRAQIARSLRRVCADAENELCRPLCSGVPIRRQDVMAWREALLGLADRLEAPVAVTPCGVARLLALLTDGTGPLYSRGSKRSICDAVWWIADGLHLCPPHAWGCPVIMKLDPEHVAWTCGRCGAIATTGDPAVRPA